MDVRAGADVFTGSVAKEGFTPDLTDWHEEGLGRFRLDGERMVIDAREGGYTAFWKTPLPADMLVRYRVRPVEPYEQNNFNLISHCRPSKPGWPVVEDGRYAGYREFENYIVTFVGDWDDADRGRAGNRTGRVRFRRNPGFEMVREQFPESEYGREYEIAYVVRSGCLRYYIDGRKIDEWQDPSPLAGGFFGLRTFCTTAEYRDLLILDLSGGQERA